MAQSGAVHAAALDACQRVASTGDYADGDDDKEEEESWRPGAELAISFLAELSRYAECRAIFPLRFGATVTAVIGWGSGARGGDECSGGGAVARAASNPPLLPLCLESACIAFPSLSSSSSSSSSSSHLETFETVELGGRLRVASSGVRFPVAKDAAQQELGSLVEFTVPSLYAVCLKACACKEGSEDGSSDSISSRRRNAAPSARSAAAALAWAAERSGSEGGGLENLCPGAIDAQAQAIVWALREATAAATLAAERGAARENDSGSGDDGDDAGYDSNDDDDEQEYYAFRIEMASQVLSATFAELAQQSVHQQQQREQQQKEKHSEAVTAVQLLAGAITQWVEEDSGCLASLLLAPRDRAMMAALFALRPAIRAGTVAPEMSARLILGVSQRAQALQGKGHLQLRRFALCDCLLDFLAPPCLTAAHCKTSWTPASLTVASSHARLVLEAVKDQAPRERVSRLERRLLAAINMLRA